MFTGFPSAEHPAKLLGAASIPPEGFLSKPDQNRFHFKQIEIYDFSEPCISLGSAASVFIKLPFFRGIKSLQGAMPQTFPPNYPELKDSIALSHFILQ